MAIVNSFLVNSFYFQFFTFNHFKINKDVRMSVFNSISSVVALITVISCFFVGIVSIECFIRLIFLSNTLYQRVFWIADYEI